MSITPSSGAFTLKADRETLFYRLITNITIGNSGSVTTVPALWDTGASGTCISKQVVEQLNLPSLGKRTLNTASGKMKADRYLIDIALPNQVVLRNIPVCDADIGESGIGALIGMDIITLGDFAITNFNRQTVFTFRIPSKEHLNFVELD